jgi:protein-L-isoaspartate(D-aspartate) O-methyltransferase
MKTSEALVEHLQDTGALTTPRIIAAFRSIDRADFIRPQDMGEAYGDYPLSIGHYATISQPTTVALMLEWLRVREGDSVLDVGSGSCWTTVLLAHIVGAEGAVWGVEVVPELVAFGTENLKKYSFTNARNVHAEKSVLGLPQEAPFDKILVSASAEQMPKELFGQLAKGGVMAVPVQSAVWVVKKAQDGTIEQTEHPGFAFVPLQ